MVKNHLKTIAAPKSWPVKRKERTFILRPDAGPHDLKNSISLNFLLIDLLGLCKTKRESTYLLRYKEILVDGKRRTNIAFPVGLMDVVTIKDMKKHYRIMLNSKGKIEAREIADKESAIKLHKITGKSLVKKKNQLNLFDGKNMLIDKGDYKVGDSILVEFAGDKIKEHFELKKGNTILLTGGRHTGSMGKIEEIIGTKIIYKVGKDDVYETLKKYAFVVGADKPVVEL